MRTPLSTGNPLPSPQAYLLFSQPAFDASLFSLFLYRVRYAALHTMNVSAGPLKWVDWWMSFLNYQIEHHLFPSMPQYRHPETSKRVQLLFAKHGLKYDQRSYTEAIKVTFENLHKVGMDVFYG